jgi:hypothetical protein
MPTWALEQKAAANRQVIAIMRRHLAAGEEVARIYQEPGLCCLFTATSCRSSAVSRSPS